MCGDPAETDVFIVKVFYVNVLHCLEKLIFEAFISDIIRVVNISVHVEHMGALGDVGGSCPFCHRGTCSWFHRNREL